MPRSSSKVLAFASNQLTDQLSQVAIAAVGNRRCVSDRNYVVAFREVAQVTGSLPHHNSIVFGREQVPLTGLAEVDVRVPI